MAKGAAPVGRRSDRFRIDVPLGAPPPAARGPMVLPSPDILGEPMSTGAVDPMSLLGFDPAVQPSAHVPRAENLAAGSVLAEPYSAPAVQMPVSAAPLGAPGGAIPD